MGFFDTVKKGAKGVYDDVKGNETVKGVHTFLKERSSNVAHEMMESSSQERKEHKSGRERFDGPHKPRKHVSGRLPRGSQPPGYDGSFDMFGGPGGMSGGMGSGMRMSMDSDMFDVSDYGREASEPRATPRRRRKQKSKRARVYEDVQPDMMAPGHIPKYLRHMF